LRDRSTIDQRMSCSGACEISISSRTAPPRSQGDVRPRARACARCPSPWW
jgi:hypothetical protein